MIGTRYTEVPPSKCFGRRAPQFPATKSTLHNLAFLIFEFRVPVSRFYYSRNFPSVAGLDFDLTTTKSGNIRFWSRFREGFSRRRRTYVGGPSRYLGSPQKMSGDGTLAMLGGEMVEAGANIESF